MIRLFYSQVVKWLAAVRWDDFLRVVSAVSQAQAYLIKTDSMSDAEKAEVNAARVRHVGGFLSRVLPALTGWKKNVVLELAVAWFNRKGEA